MKKIYIIGTSCSGKTTLGKKFSSKYGIPYYDIDDYFWKPGWENISKDELYQIFQKIIRKEKKWIITGNYSCIQEMLFNECDAVIWKNPSLLRILGRAIYRTLKRSLLKEECCNGNFESVMRSFLSFDSIIIWILKTYFRRKKIYSEKLNKISGKKIIIMNR